MTSKSSPIGYAIGQASLIGSAFALSVLTSLLMFENKAIEMRGRKQPLPSRNCASTNAPVQTLPQVGISLCGNEINLQGAKSAPTRNTTQSDVRAVGLIDVDIARIQDQIEYLNTRGGFSLLLSLLPKPLQSVVADGDKHQSELLEGLRALSRCRVLVVSREGALEPWFELSWNSGQPQDRVFETLTTRDDDGRIPVVVLFEILVGRDALDSYQCICEQRRLTVLPRGERDSSAFDFRWNQMSSQRAYESAERTIAASLGTDRSGQFASWYFDLRRLSTVLVEEARATELGLTELVSFSGAVFASDDGLENHCLIKNTMPRNGVAKAFSFEPWRFDESLSLPKLTLSMSSFLVDKRDFAAAFREKAIRIPYYTHVPILFYGDVWSHAFRKKHDTDIFVLFEEHCSGRVVALKTWSGRAELNAQLQTFLVECDSEEFAVKAVEAVSQLLKMDASAYRGHKLVAFRRMPEGTSRSIVNPLTGIGIEPTLFDTQEVSVRAILPHVSSIGRYVVWSDGEEGIHQLIDATLDREARWPLDVSAAIEQVVSREEDASIVGVSVFRLSETGKAVSALLDKGKLERVLKSLGYGEESRALGFKESEDDPAVVDLLFRDLKGLNSSLTVCFQEVDDGSLLIRMKTTRETDQ